MKKNFVKCCFCWRCGVRQANGICGYHGNKCGEEIIRNSIGYGCTKGVTTSTIIAAITEELAIKRQAVETHGNILGHLEKETDKQIEAHRSLQKHKELLLKLSMSSKGENGKTCKVNVLFPPSIDDIHTKINEYIAKLQARMLRAAISDQRESMSTFCCQNCQEPVIVPKDMLKDEIRFKCFACHQDNHYDLS